VGLRGSASLPDETGLVSRPMEISAIPYYANANRAPAEMRVWLPEAPAR
jgi:DUF1680 family protein